MNIENQKKHSLNDSKIPLQKNDFQHRYSNDIFDKRIAVLGPIPPPLGGVSVHVQRVIAKLQMQRCAVFHMNTCVEYRYRFLWLYLVRLIFFLVRVRPESVHFHTLYVSNGLQELRILIWLKHALKFDLILIEHDCRYLYTKELSWKNSLNRLLPFIAQHVYIGNRTAQSFIDTHIIPAQKISMEGAFLPPNTVDEQKILATYPFELFTFLDQHSVILLANAFALALLEGKDLYGFDLCIKALKGLRDEGVDVGLIFVFGYICDESYFKLCMQMIEEFRLQEYIFILTGQKELWPLMRRVDIFLRPTLSDGASVSIEEALWCGRPVIASDVCMRPNEVMLFKTGNAADLQRVLEEILVRYFGAQSSIVVKCDTKIDHICYERCNYTSVDSADRN